MTAATATVHLVESSSAIPDPGVKTCPKCTTDWPATPDRFYRDKTSRDGLGSWCKTCVNERTKPQTRARLIRSRAWHRAAQALIEAHREEFDDLYLDARADAIEEDDQLTADPVNHARSDAEGVRLKSGPRRNGEDVTARVDEDWCLLCSRYHAQGHHERSEAPRLNVAL